MASASEEDFKPYEVQCEPAGPAKETRPKRPKPPLALSWDAVWPRAYRSKLFALMLMLDGVLVTIGFLAIPSISASLTTMILLGSLQAFLLGTFERLELTRSSQGKVTMMHTWRVAFYPRQPVRVRWRGFEGLATGKSFDPRFEDWVLAVVLFACGVIPGVLWLYYVVLPERVYVALCRDHGFADTILYRGTDEAKAKEVAQTIADVTGLPYN